MKYTNKIIIIFLICTVPILAVNSQDYQIVKKIDSVEANKLITDNEINPDFVILDVRTPEEFNSGHIENAINIDYKSTNFKDEVKKLDKNKIYVVYCHSGRRAAASGDIMEQLGFKNIYNIGGVLQWQEAGYKLTDPESK